MSGHENCSGEPSLPAEASSPLQALRRELQRSNYAGRTVSLAEGATVIAGVCLFAARRTGPKDALVLAGIGALGLADDIIEPRRRRAGHAVAKGLKGHLGALREGRLTTGGAKALGIPLLALAGAASGPRRRGGMLVLTDAALTAGCANLVNLLDLRPGRALKAVLPVAAMLAVAPVKTSGAISAPQDATGERAARDANGRHLAWAALIPAALALPTDLREIGMLGDAGANVLGAAVGTAAARRLPGPLRLGALAGVIALTLASEKVSFSAVIDANPVLHALDQLGRREPQPSGSAPAASPGGGA